LAESASDWGSGKRPQKGAKNRKPMLEEAERISELASCARGRKCVWNRLLATILKEVTAME